MQCRKCAAKAATAKRMQAPNILEKLKAISLIGAEKNRGNAATRNECLPKELKWLRVVGSGARGRCNTVSNSAYKYYGARGIQFKFASTLDFAWWVIENLGDRPTKHHSIDRIDNNRHYEAGNLRWATRAEQARNKRQYLGNVYGHRMQKLMETRPDYTYEGLRKYLLLGYSDEQIISMEKPKGGRPRKDKDVSTCV